MKGNCDQVCACCGRTLMPSRNAEGWVHAATQSAKCPDGGTAEQRSAGPR
jgi:hypothetical protein